MKLSKLKLYRVQHGLSLSAFAALLGVNKSTAMRWERDGVPFIRLAQVQNATGINMKKLRPDLFNEAK